MKSNDRLPKDTSTAVARDLKKRAYWRTIHRIRAHMTPRQRFFSRIVHQPFFDSLSSFMASTFAAPEAILGGAISSLIGNAILLLFSGHFGLNYNYTANFYFFGVGYVIGIVVTILRKLIRKVK